MIPVRDATVPRRLSLHHFRVKPGILGYGHLSGDLNSAVIAEKWGTLW
jgi:hypothetical protein